MSRRRPLPSAALEAHASSLGACRRCGHGDAVPIVSPSREARVMLDGQAPGKTETVDRRPFAGRAGKTLFRWLAAAGVDEPTARQRIYIAAMTRCYPGPSPSGRGDRVPSPRERELCASWLDAELAIIRPRLIIPVGRLAINRFLSPGSLETMIGRAHRGAPAGEETEIIPLPHPSGASSWVHERNHRALVDEALALLGDRFRALDIASPASRRSVA